MISLKENSWNYLNQINHNSSASWEIFGGASTVLFISAVMLLLAVLLSGCSTVQRVAQQTEVAEEVVEQGEDLARAGENFADQAGETGKAARQLAPQRSCVEAKNTENRFQVNARLVGTDQRHTLSLNEYERFDLSGGWFTDRHTFTIEMEVFDKKTGQFTTRAQTVENEFSEYEVTKKGCGVLYFTSDGESIQGLQKPGKVNLN
jgi:hypothetical protein